jgi:hypothetical protein
MGRGAEDGSRPYLRKRAKKPCFSSFFSVWPPPGCLSAGPRQMSGRYLSQSSFTSGCSLKTGQAQVGADAARVPEDGVGAHQGGSQISWRGF